MPNSARAIVVSTCHVYGTPVALPIAETHRCRPEGVYSSTKYKAEQVAQSLDRDVVIVRAFHHTGPGQNEAYALSDWAAQLRRGAPEIRVGNLQIRRDYTDVRDVVAGYRLAAEQGVSGEIYNLCAGESHSMGSLLSMLTANTSVRVATQPDRFRKADVPELCGDPSKFRTLGWKRKYSIQETMASMIVD